MTQQAEEREADVAAAAEANTAEITTFAVPHLY